MLYTVPPAARSSYEAYVAHIKCCPRCAPTRCATGEELCQAYLADTRKKS